MINGILEEVRELVGVSDSSLDSLLKIIINNSEKALKIRLGLFGNNAIVPSELTYIISEVAIKRYNRIKNEGMTSYSQEGESITFNTNDFDEFSDEINSYLDHNNKSKRAVKFINPYSG